MMLSQYLFTASSAVVQLRFWDWVVVAMYGILMFAIAFRYYFVIKDCGGFFVGSRKMGRMSMVAASFSGGTNASHPMAVAAASFQSGMQGVWLSLTWILITPFLWMYPPAVRRLRIVTTVDIVRMRFGPLMAGFFKVVSLLAVPIGMGLGIKSAAIVLEISTGGTISGMVAIAIVCIPTILYTLLGGVIAAYVTDIYQGLLIVILSFLIIPFAVFSAGGLTEFRANVDAEVMSLFSSASGDFGFWWIFWFSIGITFAATISFAGGAAAARDEMTSRMKVWGTIIKRFCTLGWGWVGVIGLALFSGHPLLDVGGGHPGASPDNVFAVLSSELLPVGLVGLMIASIIAAVMSSLDASAIYFSSMAVNNVYLEHFVKGASPRHYLIVARLFCILGLALGWWVATGINDIVHFATISEPINGIVGMAIFMAIIWRRVTSMAAIASVCVSVPLYILVSQPTLGWGVPLFHVFQLHIVADWVAGLYSMNLFDPMHGYVNAEGWIETLPVQVRYPMYIIPSLLTIIGVSFLTRQHSEREVTQFYCRLDTPVGDEEKIRDAGFVEDNLIALDREAPAIEERKLTGRSDRLLLVDILYLPGKLRRGEVKLWDYRWDWLGVIGFAAFVYLFLMSVELLGRFFV
ncbi:MAG: hypothetical protein JJU20_11395 [Opitutales bacterium]|nr:hypothetical protein [Opitutales bacterium]